jgi:ubiquinone/menaquinone biosynthesis C-methylase UbiE
MIKNKFDKIFYPKFSDNWDNKQFRAKIESCLDLKYKILDLGAGAGYVKEMNFKNQVDSIAGIDFDPRVLENTYLDESKIMDSNKIPFDDNSFDLVFCNNVFEHLEDPLETLNEISRVLKPSGILLFKTPNKWHYVPLIASLTPHIFHQFINKIRGRNSDDTFPTFYRANSNKTLRSLAKESGFTVNSIDIIEGRPEYLRVFPLLYLFGVLYERIVNSSNFFSKFRVVIIGEFKNIKA